MKLAEMIDSTGRFEITELIELVVRNELPNWLGALEKGSCDTSGKWAN